MKLETMLKLLALGAVIGGGIYVYRKFKDELATTFNPVSDKNIAYTTTTAVLAPITGDKLSAGGGVFDDLHVLVKKPDGTLDTVLKAELWFHGDWIPWNLKTNSPATPGS